MDSINIKGTYEMDLDKNGFVALTEKNVQFINGVLSLDSSYRKAFRAEKDSAAFYIKNVFYNNGKFSHDPEEIEEVIRRIDKENSTHLAVSGSKKGDNKGIEKTKNKVSELFKEENEEIIVERLKAADADLVAEIAAAVENRNNFSFASKFCTFVTRAAFDEDGYCIYDKVLSDVLPYYAWVYLGENKYINKNNNSIIEKTFKDSKDYNGYRDLVNSIIAKSNEITGANIKKSDFDHLIWYYFKGDEKLVHKCLARVGQEDARIV